VAFDNEIIIDSFSKIAVMAIEMPLLLRRKRWRHEMHDSTEDNQGTGDPPMSGAAAEDDGLTPAPNQPYKIDDSEIGDDPIVTSYDKHEAVDGPYEAVDQEEADHDETVDQAEMVELEDAVDEPYRTLDRQERGADHQDDTGRRSRESDISDPSMPQSQPGIDEFAAGPGDDPAHKPAEELKRGWLSRLWNFLRKD
jgi:hypothetical protein